MSRTGGPAAATAVSFPSGSVLRRDPTDDTVTFLKHPNLTAEIDLKADFVSLVRSGRSMDIIVAFVTHYAQLFRLNQPGQEWQHASTTTDDLGITHVRLNQYYAGVQVWASEIVCHFDPGGNLYLVHGHYIPTPDHLSLQPNITPADARELAYEHLGRPYIPCPRCDKDLVVMPQGNGPALLVYRLQVQLSMAEGWRIFVDAHDGQIVKQITTVIPGATAGP